MIELVINPKEKDLGDDFIVRRSLPDARKRMVGPFIFWDHMGPVKLKGEKELKVRAHPHIGLATITYLFSGFIMHRDSLGNEQEIRPGEVNWMTAGKGIVHSERTRTDEEIELEGIQLWLALPLEHEEVNPSFVHQKEKDLPMIEKDGLNLRLIAGSFLEKCSPIPVYSDLFYLKGELNSGSAFEHSLKENQEAAIYIIGGEAEVEGQTFGSHHLIIFKKGSSLNIKAKQDTKLMIFGGEVFPEGRHIWWNFVSSSKERIEKAKQDWLDGNYDDVINEDEFIPLPQD